MTIKGVGGRPTKENQFPEMAKGKNKNAVMAKDKIVEAVVRLTYPDIMGSGKKRMTVKEAVSKIGVCSYFTFLAWLDKDPVLKAQYENAREAQKRFMQLAAENNIYDAITGVSKLPVEKKVDISFKYLERTSDDYNPKQKVEINRNTMNFNMSLEDMQRRIMELSSSVIVDGEFTENEEKELLLTPYDDEHLPEPADNGEPREFEEEGGGGDYPGGEDGDEDIEPEGN